jgi:flagellar motor protein MotB
MSKKFLSVIQGVKRHLVQRSKTNSLKQELPMTKNTSSALYFTGMICLTVACCLIGWLVNQRDQRALQYAQLAAQVDGGSVDTNESTVAQQPEHTTTTATTDTATKKPTTSTYTLQKDEYPILLMRAR